MVGFTDFSDVGFFPLQDHGDGQISFRQMLAGGRVVRMEDPATANDPEATMLEYGRENGMGTLGDVHPWMFWQVRDRAVRGMGAWSMVFAGVVGDATTSGNGPVTGPPQAGVLPVRDSTGAADTRFVSKSFDGPRCLPTIPKGVFAVVLPCTEESQQHEVVLPIDNRLVAPNIRGSGEMASIVVDLQPENELCMDGATEPGVGGRHARLQSLVRVIALPDSGLPVLGTGRGNMLAVNYGLSGVDRLAGMGAVFGMMTGGGGGGPLTGARPAGASPPEGPQGARAVAGEPNIGSGAFGAVSGGEANSGEERGVCDFGEFSPSPQGGHGVGMLAQMGACGPIHLGDANDKHRIGEDRDGNPINSAHISTNAYFFRDRERDGPLLFAGDYPYPPPWPLKARTHLTWDPFPSHKFVSGARNGYWRWWTEVPFMSPTKVPTTPATPPTRPPGRPPAPGTPRPGAPSTPRPARPGQPPTPTPTPPNTPPGGPARPGTPGGPTIPVRPGPGPGRSWTRGAGLGPTTPGPGIGGPGPQVTTPPPPTPPTRPGPSFPGPPPPPGTPTPPPPGTPTTGEPDGVGPPAPPTGRRPGDPPGPPPPRDDNHFGTAERLSGEAGVIPIYSPRMGSTGFLPIDNPLMGGVDPVTGDPEDVPGVVAKVGGVSMETAALYSIHHPMQEGFAAITFRPQLTIRGAPHFEHNPQIPSHLIEADEEVRPHVLTARAWGNQSASGDWGYTQSPYSSRARGGSSNGGVLLSPPRFEMEDYLLTTDADVKDVTGDNATTSYFMAAPGVGFALGTPDSGGGVANASVTITQSMGHSSGNEPLVVAQQIAGAAKNLIVAHASASEVIVELGLGGNQAIAIPRGTTAQRPTGSVGMVRIVTNATSGFDELEFWDEQNSGWTQIGASGGGGAPSAHSASHESGGSDTINHDSLVGFVANEHIDWTSTSENLSTTGTINGIDIPGDLLRPTSRNFTQQSRNNSATTALEVATHSVTAGTTGTTTLIRLRLSGYVVNDAVGSETLQVTVKAGGGTIYQDTAIIEGTSTNAYEIPFVMELDFFNTGATTAQRMRGWVELGDTNSEGSTGIGNLGTVGTQARSPIGGASSINTGSDNMTLSVELNWTTTTSPGDAIVYVDQVMYSVVL